MGNSLEQVACTLIHTNTCIDHSDQCSAFRCHVPEYMTTGAEEDGNPWLAVPRVEASLCLVDFAD